MVYGRGGGQRKTCYLSSIMRNDKQRHAGSVRDTHKMCFIATVKIHDGGDGYDSTL